MAEPVIESLNMNNELPSQHVPEVGKNQTPRSPTRRTFLRGFVGLGAAAVTARLPLFNTGIVKETYVETQEQVPAPLEKHFSSIEKIRAESNRIDREKFSDYIEDQKWKTTPRAEINQARAERLDPDNRFVRIFMGESIYKNLKNYLQNEKIGMSPTEWLQIHLDVFNQMSRDATVLPLPTAVLENFWIIPDEFTTLDGLDIMPQNMWRNTQEGGSTYPTERAFDTPLPALSCDARIIFGAKNGVSREAQQTADPNAPFFDPEKGFIFDPWARTAMINGTQIPFSYGLVHELGHLLWFNEDLYGASAELPPNAREVLPKSVAFVNDNMSIPHVLRYSPVSSIQMEYHNKKNYRSFQASGGSDIDFYGMAPESISFRFFRPDGSIISPTDVDFFAHRSAYTNLDALKTSERKNDSSLLNGDSLPTVLTQDSTPIQTQWGSILNIVASLPKDKQGNIIASLTHTLGQEAYLALPEIFFVNIAKARGHEKAAFDIHFIKDIPIGKEVQSSTYWGEDIKDINWHTKNDSRVFAYTALPPADPVYGDDTIYLTWWVK